MRNSPLCLLGSTLLSPRLTGSFISFSLCCSYDGEPFGQGRRLSFAARRSWLVVWVLFGSMCSCS